jgi:Nucleotidyltransferase substrate binding protein like
VNDLSFSDLLRRALDAGLPMQLDTWRRWRDLRKATSHAYDEDRANEVALAAAEFAADVTLLLKALEA